MIKIYEVKITLFLKTDIEYKNIHEKLASNVNKALFEDDKLKNIHMDKQYKPYVIGNLYPFDPKSKIYKSNQIYILTIRSVDKEFLSLLTRCLKFSNKLDFNVIASEFNEVRINYIESVFTLTPALISITDENNKIKNWVNSDGSLDFVKKRIKGNLEKKYFQLFGEKITAPDDFINMIEIQNKVPIVFDYKNSKFFTNKFKIVFNNDELSQKLAFLAFGVGLLEKNSLGFGFLQRIKSGS